MNRDKSACLTLPPCYVDTKKRHGRSVVRASYLDGPILNDVVRNGSLRRRFGDALHLDL